MQTQQLGNSQLQVTRLSYGCMRIAGGWDRDKVTADDIANGIKILEAAVEAGYTFFDHADIYGDTMCEAIFGQALKAHPDWRQNMVIATKCGIRFADDDNPAIPHRYDFSKEHILTSVDDSLERLNCGEIDLLMLHRPDYLADPAEIAEAFTKLRQAGKVREFGVSNFRPSLLAAVQKALDFPLVVNQVEIHPLRLACFTDGTLDQCLELGITPMAWSPVAGGRVATGHTPKADAKNLEHHTELLRVLDATAAEYGADRTTIVLAWLLKHPSNIIPVIGTVNPNNIRTAAKALDLQLTRETWYTILRAAAGEKLP